MISIRDAVRVVTCAARIGFAELAAIYTLRSWLLGWFVRLVTQAVFFSMFGLLLRSAELAHYRVIGNTAVLVCIEAAVVILSTVRERNSGTLPLQVIAPTPFVLTYLARGIYTLVVGVGSSSAAFAVVVVLFGVPVLMPQALLTPVFLAVIGLCAYCFALAVGAVVMRLPAMQWLALNMSYLSVMAFGGVNVPVSFWPPPLRALAQVLPLTHGLAALRGFLAGGSVGDILRDVGLELTVGAGWLAAAIAFLQHAVRHGRHDGTLELSG